MADRSVLGAVAGWVVRHLPELVVLALVVRGWEWVAGRTGVVWAEAAAVALASGVLAWARSRRVVFAVGGCLLTRARLRAALGELRLARRDGRPPYVLGLAPTAAGERVWLLCPVAVGAQDIADEADRLAAACFARTVRVRESRRWSALVVLDVVRREPPGDARPVGLARAAARGSARGRRLPLGPGLPLGVGLRVARLRG